MCRLSGFFCNKFPFHLVLAPPFRYPKIDQTNFTAGILIRDQSDPNSMKRKLTLNVVTLKSQLKNCTVSNTDLNLNHVEKRNEAFGKVMETVID